jgi:hypothetical protein
MPSAEKIKRRAWGLIVMNANHRKTEEEIIAAALDLLEQGKKPEEILTMIPEHGELLKEMFATVRILRKKGEEVVAPRALLSKIVSQIPSENLVTVSQGERYSYSKGRFFLINLADQIYRSMTPKLKIWLPVGAVAVVLLLVFLASSGPKQTGRLVGTPPVLPQEVEPTEIVVPASGNVSELVGALIQTSSDEKTIAQGEGDDAALVTADSKEVDAFGQSLYE